MSNRESPAPTTKRDESGGEARQLLIALNASRGVPRPTLYRLAGNLERLIGSEANPRPGSAARQGLRADEIELLQRLRRRASATAREEATRAADLGARIVTRIDADYPRALLDLEPPPPVLYVRGELPAGRCLTVIGSRKSDLYGLETARVFARELARAGLAIVSGFARGIDAAAHRGAIEAPAGRTIAVLGCGLGVDYPVGQVRLGDEIAAQGCLISEHPPGTPPARWQFPVRNRILAALSEATLVVRARARSGSLITADYALELGREVFAIPGSIWEPGSEAPNALIALGATPALTPGLVAEALGLGGRPAKRDEPEPDGDAGRLLRALPPTESRWPEQLAEASHLELARVQGLLLELEMAGRVVRLPGGAYLRPL